jgi:hypothetical protein
MTRYRKTTNITPPMTRATSFFVVDFLIALIVLTSLPPDNRKTSRASQDRVPALID